MEHIETTTRLNMLTTGEQAVISEIEMEGLERRRLLDLGLVLGTRVAAEFTSPLGDPTAYRIRGALIALRADQASRVIVQKLHESEGNT